MPGGHTQNTADYLSRTEQWTVRNMVAGYLKASELFQATYAQTEVRTAFPHASLAEICDLLFELNQQCQVLYRDVNGRNNRNGKRNARDHRREPRKPEVDFVINVGLLFHTALVTRELKYIFDHYIDFTEDFVDAGNDLCAHLATLDKLFRAGPKVLVGFLDLHADNILVLVYLLKSGPKFKYALGSSHTGMLRKLLGKRSLSDVYLDAADYFVESGWYADAAQLVARVLKRGPRNRRALDLQKRLPDGEMASAAL